MDETKLRTSYPRSKKVEKYNDSQTQEPITSGAEKFTEELLPETANPKSREQRKLDMIMKTFEKMEEASRRKIQHSNRAKIQVGICMKENTNLRESPLIKVDAIAKKRNRKKNPKYVFSSSDDENIFLPSLKTNAVALGNIKHSDRGKINYKICKTKSNTPKESPYGDIVEMSQKRIPKRNPKYVEFDENISLAFLRRKKKSIRKSTSAGIASNEPVKIPVRIAIKKTQPKIVHSFQGPAMPHINVNTKAIFAKKKEIMKRFSWDFLHDVEKVFDSRPNSTIAYDVTLCCIDSSPKRVYVCQAHKVLLSAASPVLSDVLKTHSSSSSKQSIIHLKGISKVNIDLVLGMIYNGSVDVPISQLESFLNAAEMIKLKGVAKSESINDFGILYDTHRYKPEMNSVMKESEPSLFTKQKCPYPFAKKSRAQNVKSIPWTYSKPALSRNMEFIPVHYSGITSCSETYGTVVKSSIADEEQIFKAIEDTISGVTTNTEPTMK